MAVLTQPDASIQQLIFSQVTLVSHLGLALVSSLTYPTGEASRNGAWAAAGR